MKIEQIMERAGISHTGRAIAYIKDALIEMNTISETHVGTVRFDIEKDKRFYKIPFEAVKIIDIRCKDHRNEEGKYRTIPRMVYKPEIVDTDGE
tara:strand:- start:837 stop:1118 length:282 start_codon:yes stop_codon:yes gene_type:complete